MSEPAPRQGICTYCGSVSDVTDDHVIPQCLFPGKIPTDVPRVWACQHCNGVVKSQLDTYLRDLLVTDMHSSRSPIAKQLYPKFERSAARNRSKLARDIIQKHQLVELHTPGGVYGGQAYTSQEVDAKLLDILSIYVRGLYAYYYHKPLSKDVEFDFLRAYINKELNDIIRGLRNGGGIATVGDGKVFQCAYGHISDVPEADIWVLNFFERALFVVFVMPKDMVQTVQVSVAS